MSGEEFALEDGAASKGLEYVDVIVDDDTASTESAGGVTLTVTIDDLAGWLVELEEKTSLK